MSPTPRELLAGVLISRCTQSPRGRPLLHAAREGRPEVTAGATAPPGPCPCDLLDGIHVQSCQLQPVSLSGLVTGASAELPGEVVSISCPAPERGAEALVREQAENGRSGLFGPCTGPATGWLPPGPKAGIPSRLVSGTGSKRALRLPKRDQRDSTENCEGGAPPL